MNTDQNKDSNENDKVKFRESDTKMCIPIKFRVIDNETSDTWGSLVKVASQIHETTLKTVSDLFANIQKIDDASQNQSEVSESPDETADNNKNTEQNNIDIGNIFSSISNKNQSAIQVLMTDVLQYDMSLKNILEKIRNKNEEGIQNWLQAVLSDEDSSLSQVDILGNTSAHKVSIDENNISNQFISDEMGSKNELEQIRRYAHKPSQQKIQQQFDRQRKLFKLVMFLKRKQLSNMSQSWKAIHLHHSSASPRKQRDSRQQSAQSQRIRSASKKGSEGSEEIQFDLTMRSKNSKNHVSLIKQDSLMYSAQSGFGLRMESPDKSQRVKEEENLKLQKIEDDHQEDHGSILYMDKSLSQKIISDTNSQKEEIQSIPNKINENRLSNPEQQGNLFTPIKQIGSAEIVQKDSHLEQQSEKCSEIDRRLMASAENGKSEINDVKKRIQTQNPPKREIRNQRKAKSIFNKMGIDSPGSKLHTDSNSMVSSSSQNKIAQLREVKELKKKKLELELARINNELQQLKIKEEIMGSPKKTNNYASRLKISNNKDAKVKAQRLVQNLRSQKRSRNVTKFSEHKEMDKDINSFMEELTRQRIQNEERLKQKKKMEVLERMKKNEIRKSSERKKIEESQKFLLNLKDNYLLNKSKVKNEDFSHQSSSKRIPTHNPQIPYKLLSKQSRMTPQLSHKKAYLNKIRNFSIKKHSHDKYEQVLG